MTTERDKMLAGQLYDASDAELKTARKQAREKIRNFNQEVVDTKRTELLKSWLGSTGENIYIEPHFACDYGTNIHVGENFYANFNCTMLDVCEIRIGKNAMLGPNVQLLTPLHPLDAEERIAGLEYGAPITIGDNVWIGGGAIILPGVKLGNNVVVGAGAVVTKSFGDNVVIAGNPARVIKRIDNEMGEI
ncbi:sugar O-acetyltransferase [Streptococcus merionis]|uniref:Acetyltransferase n=1 Tax=Streptococcus merionis TaxID=400065 RepID=A0A239ST36_9STRE|nr:sugar O-acetyltransferase [Streptococcus merionis]SNU88580.1 maltose O-acetyltransferase [Streptococcus merionis]